MTQIHHPKTTKPTPRFTPSPVQLRGLASISRRPSAGTAGIFVLEHVGQSMRTDIIETLQHRESDDRTGNSHRRETRMAGCGIRSSVIHGRGNCHAGRHLVIQQATDALSQFGSDLFVSVVIAAVGRRVNTASQIAFQ